MTYCGLIYFLNEIHAFALKHYEESQVLRITLVFVPGLISISYPLIIQTISRLNDQYKSTHIIGKFKKEWKQKWFSYSLVASVVLVLSTVIHSGWLVLAAFVSVINLLASFVFTMRLLMTYLSGAPLFKHFLKKVPIDNSKNIFLKKPTAVKKMKAQIMEYWHPMIDLFLYAVRNDDFRLQNDIRILFIQSSIVFYKVTEAKESSFIEFPDEFYNSTTEILISYLDRKSYRQEDLSCSRLIGSVFFPENQFEYGFKTNSPKTLIAIWWNLILLIDNNKDSLVLKYWASAHQYCRFELYPPNPKTDDKFQETPESVELRKSVRDHRDFFIEFHTFFLSYVYYRGKFELLSKLLDFTQSEPASYELYYKYPTEIFNRFYETINRYGSEFRLNYSFGEIDFDGFGGQTDVKAVFREFLGLLFLFINKGSLQNSKMPEIPRTPPERGNKKFWKEYLSVFENNIKDHLSKKELLAALHLNIETSNTFILLSEYFKDLKSNIEGEFIQSLEHAKLDHEKTNAVDEYAVKAITEAYKNVKRIAGHNVINDSDRDEYSVKGEMEAIRGTRTPLSKDAFIKDSSTASFNFDSITTQIIIGKYYEHVSAKMLFLSEKYYIPNGKFFEAVDKFELDPKQYIIVSFNKNLAFSKEFGIDIHKVEGEINFYYKSIPIYSFSKGTWAADRTLFILHRKDLPMLEHKDWKQIEDLPSDAKKYWSSMEPISEDIHLYRRFIPDILAHPEVKAQYISDGLKEDELKHKCEVNIDFIAHFWFRKGVRIICLKEGDMFEEGGRNDMDKIKPVEPEEDNQPKKKSKE